jgi:Fe-S-cluster containining protein
MNLKSHCKNCKENNHCCIFKNNSGFTFVSIKDAKAIHNAANKDYNYFLDYSPLQKKVVSALKYSDPLLEGRLRYSQLDNKNRILRLKIKPDGKCIFLNELKLCEIYKNRPSICKIFPFWAIKCLNSKMRVIAHDSYPKCTIITSAKIKQQDAEKILSKKEIQFIKTIMKTIEYENNVYRKNIHKFVKEYLST